MPGLGEKLWTYELIIGKIVTQTELMETTRHSATESKSQKNNASFRNRALTEGK